MRKMMRLLAIAALALAGSAAQADDLPLAHERFVLGNGLTVIVNEDRSAPLVSVEVRYRVGSGQEPPGKTGFAHLFEHLMFNGSEHQDGEWVPLLQSIGATTNGGAGWDFTKYYETFPTSALDRVLWLESDRMGHLLGVITQAKLDEQRGVVQNEKREGDNRALTRLFERRQEVLFPSGHPYGRPPIGSMADLNGATLEDVRTWFRTYYAPNNAILVLSGDIDAATAKEKAARYFGDIPAAPPVDRELARIPTRLHNSSDQLHDNVSVPHIERAWVGPGRFTRDHALLTLVANILGDGRTARLTSDLVERRRIASWAFSSIGNTAMASSFQISVNAQPDGDPRAVHAAIDQVVADFLSRPPSRDELKRAQANERAFLLRRLSTGQGRAAELASGEQFAGDPAFLKTYLAWLDAAEPRDLQQAARRWLSGGWHQTDVLPRLKYQTANAVDRRSGMPPVPMPAVDKVIPAPQSTTLRNGATLVVVRRPNAPMVDIAIHFNAGNAADPPGKPGLAAFTMAILDKGTKSRTSEMLADQAAILGGGLSISSDLDTSSVGLQTTRSNLVAAVDLLTDVVENARFDPSDIARLKQDRKAALVAETADPQETAFRILRRASFGAGHPYAIPRSGLSDAGSIDGFTAADLQAFQAKWLAPGNATIIVVGDLTLAEAGALVERRMAGWRGDEGPRPSPVIPTVALPARSRLIVVDRPGAPQSLILGGTLVPGTGGPRDAAIETVNRILGGGFGSRINMNLRERKRWSYGSGSGMADARGQRSFQINAAVQTDRTADALAELVRELRDITGPAAITRQELDAAVTSSIAELPVGYESQSAVSNAIASARTFGRELDWPNRIGGQYAALTLDDLRSTARDLIDPDRMIWIVIGDRSRIETPLKALDLAPIEWFANDGRPLD